MIEFAANQIRPFFKIMNPNVLQIPICIMDFINETIQLPCIENQITLCRTTFIEDACYAFNYLKKE